MQVSVTLKARRGHSLTAVSEKQMLWMGNETANTKPTLPQLMRLKIPEETTESFLKDDTGSLVDVAEKSCPYQPDDIVTSIGELIGSCFIVAED